ncbi:MAG: hypothetical protein IKE61_02530 [Coriobacteriales bacterium]|nr:hypothetical protein [Coriobacteriales bacterium]
MAPAKKKTEVEEKTAKTKVDAKKAKEAVDKAIVAEVDEAAVRKEAARAKVAEKKPLSKRAANKKVAEAIEAAAEGKLALDTEVDPALYAQAAIEHPELLSLMVDALKGPSRRERQLSSLVIARVAKIDPTLLADSIPALVDALNRPEAQTRWETLEALYEMIPIDLAACKKGINAAEDSLYDEKSGVVRLAAFCFLCALGAQDKRTSKKVWPYIDEAIQCFHGDIEFQDMLNELVRFAEGNLHAEVKKALADRMRFDSESGFGFLKRKATAIVQICEGK